MEPVHCLLLGKSSNYSVMIALTWCAGLCELYTCTKLFCLLDQVPVNWFSDYCILRTLLFCLCFLPLLILEDASSLSLLSFSQSFACLRPTHSDMLWLKEKQTDEWTDRFPSTSVMLALWAESCGLRGCFRARFDVVARSTPRWSAAMSRMLGVHLYCLVKGSSLISSGSHT